MSSTADITILFIVCVSGNSKSKIPHRTCISPSTTSEPTSTKMVLEILSQVPLPHPQQKKKLLPTCKTHRTVILIRLKSCKSICFIQNFFGYLLGCNKFNPILTVIYILKEANMRIPRDMQTIACQQA